MNNGKAYLENVKKALVFIAEELNSHKINWLLGASGALLVHGVEIIPFDLDIFTKKENVKKLANKFSEYVINPPHNFLEEGKAFLEFQMKINGIEVEICELNMDKVHPKYIKFFGQIIPVNPLEEELEFYKKRTGKEEIVELIKKKLYFL